MYESIIPTFIYATYSTYYVVFFVLFKICLFVNFINYIFLEDESSVPASTLVPSGSGGSSIKVTLKKTRSSSSSSSRESVQSFEVRNLFSF